MARGFKSTRRGVQARLETEEIDLLQVLVAQLTVLLEPGETATEQPGSAWARDLGLEDLMEPADQFPQRPTDTALARLLPDAHSEDPLAAADFRRLTEGTVRRTKIASARTTLDVLERWKTQSPQLISRDEAMDMVKCQTDLRLVLADRLGIATEADADALHTRRGDPGEQWLAEVYDFVGWMQESLVGQLFKGIDNAGDGRRQPPPATDPQA